MSTLPVRSPLPNKRALDPVGTGHQAELGGGNPGAAVIVRVQRQDDGIAPVEMTVHPFDLVGMDFGRRHLHRRRQIEDQLVFGRRIDDLGDGVADLQRHFEFRCR